MQLETKDQLMMDNTGIKEDHLRLHNYAVADKAYDFRRELRTAQFAVADKRSIDDGQYRD